MEQKENNRREIGGSGLMRRKEGEARYSAGVGKGKEGGGVKWDLEHLLHKDHKKRQDYLGISLL